MSKNKSLESSSSSKNVSKNKNPSKNTQASKNIIKSAKTRKSRRNSERFHVYIHRVLKQVHPDEHISGKAMEIMNCFVNDIFHRIAEEAGKVAAMNERKTLTKREIQTATRLILPGELGKHAMSEGTKAIVRSSKYTYL